MPKITQPNFLFFTMTPSAYVAANGIMMRNHISIMFVKPLGLSNGCAEFVLKKPPPFVPSCLIAIWLAAGPPGIVCVAPATVVTWVDAWKFCTTPWLASTMAATNAIGTRMRSVVRIRSTQKLPIVLLPAAGEAADQRHHHREAGGGRREVLHREPGHLREVAHRRLAAVALPVRVGDEAGGGVPREVGVDRRAGGRG